ncbi:MAG: ATP-binding cassette domain-containing protein, partial [Candidatus Babeliales bacterium]
LPRLYAGASEATARQEAQKLLNLVQLGHRAEHYPYQLSGGQQQRVAIARALINNPSILLADEPTGNLDTQTGSTIIEFFKKLNAEQNVTIIIVTHEPAIAAQAKRTIELRDGVIVSK